MPKTTALTIVKYCIMGPGAVAVRSTFDEKLGLNGNKSMVHPSNLPFCQCRNLEGL